MQTHRRHSAALVVVVAISATGIASCGDSTAKDKTAGPSTTNTMSSTSGASSGTTCTKLSGTATHSPALPKLDSKNKVFATLTAIGTLSECTGGGVTSAQLEYVTPKTKTGSNCTTRVTYSATPTPGAETITWNTGQTSTVAAQLHGVKGNPTQLTVTGTVTAGLFKGLHQFGTLNITIPKGACVTTELSSVPYHGGPTFDIRDNRPKDKASAPSTTTAASIPLTAPTNLYGASFKNGKTTLTVGAKTYDLDLLKAVDGGDHTHLVWSDQSHQTIFNAVYSPSDQSAFSVVESLDGVRIYKECSLTVAKADASGFEGTIRCSRNHDDGNIPLTISGSFLATP